MPRAWLTAILVALNLIGATVAVIGVWQSIGVWEAVTAGGVATIALGQFIERHLYPPDEQGG